MDRSLSRCREGPTKSMAVESVIGVPNCAAVTLTVSRRARDSKQNRNEMFSVLLSFGRKF